LAELLWVEAALAEAAWRDAYDDALVAEARDAFKQGTLLKGAGQRRD
jgi:hypothetical protein